MLNLDDSQISQPGPEQEQGPLAHDIRKIGDIHLESEPLPDEAECAAEIHTIGGEIAIIRAQRVHELGKVA